MGLPDIAKAPVSHGVEPHDLETGLSLRFRLQPSEPPAGPRRSYRASGFVLGRKSTVGRTAGRTGWRPYRAARKGLVSALRQTLILITQLTRSERNLVPDDAAQSSGPSFFRSSPFRVDCRMPCHTVLTFSGASRPSSGRRWKTRV